MTRFHRTKWPTTLLISPAPAGDSVSTSTTQSTSGTVSIVRRLDGPPVDDEHVSLA
jgi:hypothetical protein